MGDTFEVKNTGEVKLKLFSSDPSGTEGEIIYNSTDKKLKYYNGSSWEDTGTSKILAEGKNQDGGVSAGSSWGTVSTYTPPSTADSPKLYAYLACRTTRSGSDTIQYRIIQNSVVLLSGTSGIGTGMWGGGVVFDNSGDDVLLQFKEGASTWCDYGWCIVKLIDEV